MNIRQHTYLWIACLLFSWKYGQVIGLQTKRNTWKKAVLDCYGYNYSLESNVNVLKKYLSNHTGVDSIWVGGFEALLPWIEIRGCYSIPLTCNSLERDEMVAKNSALCQLKCMKRQYFAFNQKNERCVCFDEHEAMKQESDKANLCQECKHQRDCDLYAVVYKVFHGQISVGGYHHDCLSYECNSEGADPTFNKNRCSAYCLPYCRDGQRAVNDDYLQFSKYRITCEEEHFTYPLLHSGNPVKLCDVSKSFRPGICIWVGVYRQRLDMDNLDKTVLQNFNNIAKYILHCKSLSMNGGLVRTKNCSDKLHYKCTQDIPMDFQKDLIYNSTTTPVCRSKDSGIGETDNQSSGIIAGTLTSTFVIVVAVVVIVIIYRRRIQ
ncbi:uncharacterized protein LOC127732231 [Mytilus californianus]|uniref:uncharacterized protein LOC127732231 n=1 Tax=Mytilus californianus TaxID=6549 RepID=UPI0022452FD2|nr:uncharacterized protein LOC127732231 [Mytilus californianus]